MVLQNKYKARASKRYNAARGGTPTSSERSRGTGRRGTRPAVFGVPHQDDSEDSQEEEEEVDGEFPTLEAAAKASSSAPTEAEPTERSKYAKRKMESNAWRYAEPEVDANVEVEVEAEVDLTNLFARVAALDSSKCTTLPGSNEAELQRIQDDVDTSLAYLHSRQRERERGKGRVQEAEQTSVKRIERTPEESQAAKEEMDMMHREREKAEALRALKECFMGRRVGERPTEAVRSLSLDIGAGRSSAAPLPVRRTVQRDPSLAFLGDDEEDEGVAAARLNDVDALLAATSKRAPPAVTTIASEAASASTSATSTKLGPIERERRRMAREEATLRLVPGVNTNLDAKGKDEKAGLEDFLDEMLA